MNLTFLKLHPKLIALVLSSITLTVSLSLFNGHAKTLTETDWLDVIGEGGITLMAAVWIFFILASRPLGQVTRLLTIGLTCFLCSSLLDLLDEFVSYPDHQFWLYWLEPLPAPIGMILMTWGLYQWHQEQLKLNEQLKRRESFYREHSQIDFITQLYSADYMRAQMNEQLAQQTTFSIAMLDIDKFDAFNREYGNADGDRLLHEIADIIVMNLRQTDLACRYAGDRFILLFKHTNEREAKTLVKQIQQAIRYLAFKPDKTGAAVYHHVSAGIIQASPEDNTDSIIRSANLMLEQQKQSNTGAYVEKLLLS